MTTTFHSWRSTAFFPTAEKKKKVMMYLCTSPLYFLGLDKTGRETGTYKQLGNNHWYECTLNDGPISLPFTHIRSAVDLLLQFKNQTKRYQRMIKATNMGTDHGLEHRMKHWAHWNVKDSQRKKKSLTFFYDYTFTKGKYQIHIF